MAVIRRCTVPLIALLASACASTGGECPVAGEAIQWQADYCLFLSETDDLIAAQPCMDREATRRFASDCARKTHYRRARCALAVEAGIHPGPVHRCVADPAFSGPTVRNGGA